LRELMKPRIGDLGEKKHFDRIPEETQEETEPQWRKEEGVERKRQ